MQEHAGEIQKQAKDAKCMQNGNKSMRKHAKSMQNDAKSMQKACKSMLKYAKHGNSRGKREKHAIGAKIQANKQKVQA